MNYYFLSFWISVVEMDMYETWWYSINNEIPKKKRPYHKKDFVMHMDENKNIVSVHEWISPETIKQWTQYSLWQLLLSHDNETQVKSVQEQIRIASLFWKHLKLVSPEQLESVLKQPYKEIWCIDKDKDGIQTLDQEEIETLDKEEKALNVPWWWMWLKAMTIAVLRKLLPTATTARIHQITTNVINKLWWLSYHTDDSCDVQKGHDHVHTPWCKHRELMLKDPAAYWLLQEDVDMMEEVKMPDDDRVPNVDREVIKRKTVKKEKDYTVIVSDARYLHETKGKQEDVDFPEFYYVPNVIEDEEWTTYRCYDYTKDLAHYVIGKTIAPAIKDELDENEVNEIINNYNLWHENDQKIDATAIISSTWKSTLDHHMQITVTKALSHKEKVHIMPYEKRKIPNKKKR